VLGVKMIFGRTFLLILGLTNSLVLYLKLFPDNSKKDIKQYCNTIILIILDDFFLFFDSAIAARLASAHIY
jgi:hypothetical protein